jgi:hypothetical protein
MPDRGAVQLPPMRVLALWRLWGHAYLSFGVIPVGKGHSVHNPLRGVPLTAGVIISPLVIAR